MRQSSRYPFYSKNIVDRNLIISTNRERFHKQISKFFPDSSLHFYVVRRRRGRNQSAFELRRDLDTAEQNPSNPPWQDITRGSFDTADQRGQIASAVPMLTQNFLVCPAQQSQDDQRDQIEIINLADERKHVGDEIEWGDNVDDRPGEQGLLSQRRTGVFKQPIKQFEKIGDERRRLSQDATPMFRIFQVNFHEDQGLRIEGRGSRHRSQGDSRSSIFDLQSSGFAARRLRCLNVSQATEHLNIHCKLIQSSYGSRTR